MERPMKIETLLILDILMIIAVPVAMLLAGSLVGIFIASLLTSALVYLDILTYRMLKFTKLPQK